MPGVPHRKVVARHGTAHLQWRWCRLQLARTQGAIAVGPASLSYDGSRFDECEAKATIASLLVWRCFLHAGSTWQAAVWVWAWSLAYLFTGALVVDLDPCMMSCPVSRTTSGS